MAEILVRFAQWEHNREGEAVMHGEIVRLLFRCRCWVEFRYSPSGKIVHPIMDTGARRNHKVVRSLLAQSNRNGVV